MIQPLGIFGGTFDPVHYGHLRCAEEARQKLQLDTMHLMPAARPPHRDAPKATVEDRLAMLRLALEEFPGLEIDDRETRRKGPSYMIDTLRSLREQYPDRQLLLLIGQDAANKLHGWHEWQSLFEFAHIVILTRPGARAEYRQDVEKQIQRRLCADLAGFLKTPAGGVMHLQVASIDISATTIKSIIRLGRSPASMLPASVLDYIIDRHLYQPSG